MILHPHLLSAHASRGTSASSSDPSRCFGPAMSGRYRRNCRLKGERAITPCSTSRSTASFAAVTSWRCESMTSPRTDTLSTERPSGSRRQGAQLGFALTEQTRQALDDYLRVGHRKPGEFLFAGRGGSGRVLTNSTICAPRRRVGRQHRPRPVEIRHALAPTDQGDFDLPTSREPSSRSTPARNGDILPANNRLKHASPTDFILASARPYASGGGSSEAAPRLLSCTNLTAPSRAFQCG